MSTAAKVRAVQDYALSIGNSTAMVSVYGGLVEVAAVFLDDAADTSDNLHPLRRDSTGIAARSEVPETVVAEMGAWIARSWIEITDSAAVLDALGFMDETQLPGESVAALRYRLAAEELAQRGGEVAAACRYVGGQAEARWHRLYGGRIMSSLDELATDPVLEAARRELDDAAKDRLIDWVQAVWEQIDNLASERAS
ncbi:hypothetical protein [Mycobacteroides abscessus]|uniref:hypothetical protein n=1 Tax=Mycobacteroides abscessus TaxID=36809 RepID=UPI001877E380|nr:hypothetical protein [Mycobacteroides abscessus]